MNKWKEKHCRLTWPGYSLWERVTSWIDSRMLIVNSTGPAALSGGGQGRLLFAICTSIVSLTANLAHCGIYFKPRRSTGLLLLHYFGHREAHFFSSFHYSYSKTLEPQGSSQDLCHQELFINNYSHSSQECCVLNSKGRGNMSIR